MANLTSNYWGQANFWESAGEQIINRRDSSTSIFENIASNIFDGYLIESSNSYLKIGLLPSGSAEFWGNGFMGETVEGVSMSRIRIQIEDFSGDAVGSIRFGSGVYGDVYTYGSLSSITNQYPGITTRLSGNLQFSPDGEITPFNATETTTISGGPSVISKTDAVGDYYQHKLSYQGKSLTIDGSWPYESLDSYLDLLRGDDVFYGSIGDDFFIANPGNDRIEGGSGNDTVIYSGIYSTYSIDATDRDSLKIQKFGEIDTLVDIEILKFSDQTLTISDLIEATNRTPKIKEVSAGSGDEIFQGTEGILDLVRLSSELSNYRIQKFGNTAVITDQVGNGGADTLVRIERVAFSDKAIAFDIDGISGQAYRIYKAAFDRAPDSVGLGYWIAQMDQGMSLNELSTQFINSGEFRDKYGQNPSKGEFITKLYNNVLDRDPDPGGLAWWVEEMVTKPEERTWQQVLAEFSESDENQNNVAELIANGIVFDPWMG